MGLMRKITKATDNNAMLGKTSNDSTRTSGSLRAFDSCGLAPNQISSRL
jgi:hypothetical protein